MRKMTVEFINEPNLQYPIELRETISEMTIEEAISLRDGLTMAIELATWQLQIELAEWQLQADAKENAYNESQCKEEATAQALEADAGEIS